jgi:hypothetical protein
MCDRVFIGELIFLRIFLITSLENSKKNKHTQINIKIRFIKTAEL